jgi:hypothetical protein
LRFKTVRRVQRCMDAPLLTLAAFEGAQHLFAKQ